MEQTTILIILAILTLALNTIVLAVGGTWKLSRVEASIRESLANHKAAIDTELSDRRARLDAEMNAMRREFGDALSALGRQFGETITAIRQKITEAEFYMRDNFVRKETFTTVMSNLENDMRGLGDRIEARLLRMEEKLDEAAQRSREEN